MRVRWDTEVGATYFEVTDHRVARTRHFGDLTAVDLDADGEVVGVEVLAPLYDAERFLGPVLDEYPQLNAETRIIWLLGALQQAGGNISRADIHGTHPE